MRKGANVSVAKQPSDLRNRQFSVCQMAFGQIGSKTFQKRGERQSFQFQSPGKRSLTYPELACNFADLRLAMRQQWSNGVLDPRPERLSVSQPMKSRFFAVRPQKLVEKGISADDGSLSDAIGKRDVVGGGAEFNIVAEESSKLGVPRPAVRQPHPARHKAKAGQLSTYPHQPSHPEFDLMPIQMAADPDVVERCADGFAVDAFQSNALIDDGAVPCHPL
jgi:hypothetical protein